MTHGTLIAVHAVAAAVALGAGLGAFRLPRLIGVHAIAVAAMTLALVAALVAGRDRVAQLPVAVSLGLVALALVMTVRAAGAWRRRPAAGHPVGRRVVSALGFDCISLVTGLVAVGLVRLEWVPAAIVVVAALPTLIGRIPLNRSLRRLGAAGGSPRRKAARSGRSRS